MSVPVMRRTVLPSLPKFYFLAVFGIKFDYMWSERKTCKLFFFFFFFLCEWTKITVIKIT